MDCRWRHDWQVLIEFNGHGLTLGDMAPSYVEIIGLAALLAKRPLTTAYSLMWSSCSIVLARSGLPLALSSALSCCGNGSLGLAAWIA